jgi:hypothetical protein
MRTLAFALLLLSACKTDFPSGTVQCSTDPNRRCPTGYHCIDTLDTCWKDGEAPDFGAPLDLGVDSDQGASDFAIPDLWGGDSATGDLGTVQNNVVFLVSTAVSAASLNGLSGADNHCQQAAQTAGLPGTYRAWLSTSSVNAGDRLGTARGWVRPDGLPFSDTQGDLKAGKILYPATVTEAGQVLNSWVHTGTLADGTRAVDTCSDWTSTGASAAYGYSDAGTAHWTALGVISCSAAVRFYCFGIDRSTPLVSPTVQGRRAFLTPATSVPGGGIAGADARCAAAAASAGLPGTFKALLATASTAAAARFSTGAGTPTWFRVDGVKLFDTSAGLTLGKSNAPLGVDAAGTYVVGNWIWTGMANAGTVGQTCLDWSTTDGAQAADVGSTQSTSWFATTPRNCSSTGFFLRCLEE